MNKKKRKITRCDRGILISCEGEGRLDRDRVEVVEKRRLVEGIEWFGGRK